MKSTPKSRRADRRGRLLRWGLGAALLALTPKCLVCVAAYLGIVGLLGLKVPELCGASRSGVSAWVWSAIVVIVVAITVLLWRRREHRRLAKTRAAGLTCCRHPWLRPMAMSAATRAGTPTTTRHAR